jgi:RHS repeat-associated protein
MSPHAQNSNNRLQLLSLSVAFLAAAAPTHLAQAQLLGGGGTACNPQIQSCAPAPSPIGSPSPSPSPAPNSCSPGTAGATCGGSGPASQGNSSGTNNGAGNPINVITGNKYQLEVDMPALPGELGLEIVRHYNSANARVIGALGAGWRLSYETELYVIGSSIQVLQADGSRVIFSINPQKPSHCMSADPAAGRLEIKESTNSRGQSIKEYIWHWSHGPHAGRKLHFNSQGKLEQIVSSSGAVLSLTRGPAGELLQVTDPQGRSLRLSYASKAQLQQANGQKGGAYFAGIKTIDSPLGRFSYEHGSASAGNTNNSNAAVTAATAATAANLTQVSIPTHVEQGERQHAWSNRAPSSSSIRRIYHYENPQWPQMLTGVSILGAGSDGQQTSQRLSTFLYNPRGQGILSVKGSPAQLAQDAQGNTLQPARLQEGTGQEQVHLQYIEPALHNSANKSANKSANNTTTSNNTTGLTLLTNSLGQQTLYRHQIIAGEYRLLEARGAGCAACGPVNIRYEYDKSGKMIAEYRLAPTQIKIDDASKDKDQSNAQSKDQILSQIAQLPAAQILSASKAQRDPQGNVIQNQGEQAQYSDLRWPDKPTRITRPSVIPDKQHQMEITYNDAGQITQILESGWSPINNKGEQEATAIQRSTQYSYQRINNRSVLVETDGPLPNGKTNSPQDSDITQYKWDAKASFITQVIAPGGFANTLSYDSAGRVSKTINDQGFATYSHYNSQGQLTYLASTGPGWKQPQVQSYKYNALGELIEAARGADKAALDADSKDQQDSAAQELAQLLQASAAYRPQMAQQFDIAGRPLWQANALGLMQAKRYDSEGRILQSTRTTNAIMQTENWTYQNTGANPNAIAQWQDNAGRQAGIDYDSAGRPVAYRDSTGRSINLSTASAPSNAKQAPAQASASLQQATLRLADDFGRTVLTQTAQHGKQIMRYDEADRLIAMQDAQGHRASYQHDVAGRIARQEVIAAKAEQPAQLTTWHYTGRQLTRIEHPVQSEHYQYDARGLQASKTVVLHNAKIASTTRYQHNDQGQLIASSLPDGSWLHHGRNGQDQITALTRSPVQTSWLRKLAPEQQIAADFQRDMIGLKSYQAGNAVQSQWQRSSQGDLARILHRQPERLLKTQQRLQAGKSQNNNSSSSILSGHSTQDTIERLLGITSANAQTANAQTAQPTSAQAAPTTSAQGNKQPGALDQPRDPGAFFDERYLWSGQGYLLHSQRHSAKDQANTVQLRSHAYDRQGQQIASVQEAGTQEATEQAGKPASILPTSAKSGVAPSAAAQEKSPDSKVWRYAYDSQQKRILAQETDTQEELSQGTLKTSYDNQGRVSNSVSYNANGQPEQAGGKRYHWDALGRLAKIEQSNKDLVQYSYDHRGLRNSKTIKAPSAAAQNTTHYLYSADKQLLAETDQAGNIQRQYIYLADMLLAVIDTDSKSTSLLSKDEQLAQEIRRATAQKALKTDTQQQEVSQVISQEVSLWQDSQALIGSYVDWLKGAVGSPQESIAFIHSNHLGAPEAATDREGQLIWQASYAPFGSTTQIKAIKVGNPKNSGGSSPTSGNINFTLNIRLPGQYFDAETGLHYNRARYYDPKQGSYLSPDPLGNPDGANAYAYVANNPLIYIDPDGLILFAFDGTGNDLSDQGAISNVVRFRDAYQDGARRYVSGVGTVHRDQEFGDITAPFLDAGRNTSGPARILRMQQYFEAEIRLAIDRKDAMMDIDIIGFSRGAAQARDFANLIQKRSTTTSGSDGKPRYTSGVVGVSGQQGEVRYFYRRASADQKTFECQRINFRFMGLWDTVLSTNDSGRTYQMGIPSTFKYVAHAVALNEHRSQPAGNLASQSAYWDGTRRQIGGVAGLAQFNHYGGFPLESIGAGTLGFVDPDPRLRSYEDDNVRIERGFIGAHADIGGGYPGGENQLSFVALSWMTAQAQRAGVKVNDPSSASAIPTNDPIIHDQSNALRIGSPLTDGGQLRIRRPGTNVSDSFAVEDRRVNGAVSGNGARNMGFTDFAFRDRSMRFTDTQQQGMISYTPRAMQDRNNSDSTWAEHGPRQQGEGTNQTGTVNMSMYMRWLRDNGYCFAGDSCAKPRS